jgi:hypothetical protein
VGPKAARTFSRLWKSTFPSPSKGPAFEMKPKLHPLAGTGSIEG